MSHKVGTRIHKYTTEAPMPCENKNMPNKRLLVCVGGRVFGIKDIFREGK